MTIGRGRERISAMTRRGVEECLPNKGVKSVFATSSLSLIVLN